MRTPPDLFAAARLIAFANLEPTADNWRTLWRPGGYLVKAVPPWTLPGSAALKRQPSVVRAWEEAGAKPAGALWRAFTDGAREAAGGVKRVPPVAWLDIRLTGAWSDVGRDGERIEWSEFRRLHRRVTNWLHALATGGSLLGVVRAVQRHRVAEQVLMVTAPAGAPLMRDGLHFYYAPAKRPRVTLADQLLGLLAVTGEARLWPRFFACAAPGCEQFGIARVLGRERYFCSDLCRVRASRQRVR